MATRPVRRLRLDDQPPSASSFEWLVTNGLGGYASGTLSGALTRRYHGLLISALPTPFGRTMLLNFLWERLRWPDGRVEQWPQVAIDRWTTLEQGESRAR